MEKAVPVDQHRTVDKTAPTPIVLKFDVTVSFPMSSSGLGPSHIRLFLEGQLIVRPEIGYGVVNDLVGLSGGESATALPGVGALQR